MLHSPARANAEKIRFATGTCSLGQILVAVTAKGICAISFGDDSLSLERDLRQRFPDADIAKADPASGNFLARVISAVETPSARLDLPLDPRGTPFQERVWRALREIPRGTTRSYTEIARSIGRPDAVRAVATAIGANKIAFAVPCHRAVHADGTLAGYHWGSKRKRALLEREAASVRSGSPALL